MSAAQSGGRLPNRRLFELLPPFHPLLDVFLESELARLVPFLPPQEVRQILLRNVRFVVRMSVLVPQPVPQLLHEFCGCVPDMQRNGFRRMLLGGSSEERRVGKECRSGWGANA